MKHVILLKFEKSTKNTYKFTETAKLGKPPIIGCLYIQKWAYPHAGPGTGIEATIITDEPNQPAQPQHHHE